MSEDASALQTAWMSEAAGREPDLRSAARRVLDRDAAERARERRFGVAGLTALLVLLPVLIWASAHGITPLVREAYGLMAVGCVAIVVSEWLYLEWSRRALPGPEDTRSQLQRTAFLLECRAWLGRTAALWSAPVFAGVLLISVWLYRERTPAGAIALGALDIAAWVCVGFFTGRVAASLERRRRQLQDALADL